MSLLFPWFQFCVGFTRPSMCGDSQPFTWAVTRCAMKVPSVTVGIIRCCPVLIDTLSASTMLFPWVIICICAYLTPCHSLFVWAYYAFALPSTWALSHLDDFSPFLTPVRCTLRFPLALSVYCSFSSLCPWAFHLGPRCQSRAGVL